MSHKVTTLVYSRVAGSAVRKGVLSYMADRSSDDGRGVWCSKKTIADETEFGRSTVIRTCKEFVAEGILIVAGSRKCANGATIEYALNLDAIRALPRVEKKAKGSQSGTSPDMDPSQSGTPPVPERDPKGSQSGTQTILEPSLNLPLTPKGKGEEVELDQLGFLSNVLSPETAKAFIDQRKALKKPMTVFAAKLMSERLAGIPNAEEEAKRAIRNGWQDVYPDKPRQGYQQTPDMSEKVSKWNKMGSKK